MFAPLWCTRPVSPHLDVHPWSISTLVCTMCKAPSWYTPLIGPSHLVNSQEWSRGKRKDLYSFQSLPNSVMVKQLPFGPPWGTEGANPRIIAQTKPHAGYTQPDTQPTRQIMPQEPSTPQLRSLHSQAWPHPPFLPTVRISAREGNWGWDKEQMWGFALVRSRRQLQDVFPSSAPLVNAWPLPNCRDPCLKLKAHATCTADSIFPSWFSSAQEEFSPPQRKLFNNSTQQAFNEHPLRVSHCTLVTKGEGDEVKEMVSCHLGVLSLTGHSFSLALPGITWTPPPCKVGVLNPTSQGCYKD